MSKVNRALKEAKKHEAQSPNGISIKEQRVLAKNEWITMLEESVNF